MDDPTTTRRRLLEGASVGGGALLAGCAEFVDGGSEAVEQTDSGGAIADGVGAIVTVDQEALQQEQLELREEVQAGNITREEAQERATQLREEYITEAITALSETAAATDGVAVGEEYPGLGAVILTGDAAPILGILDSEDVNALVSRADVEEQAGTPEPTDAA